MGASLGGWGRPGSSLGVFLPLGGMLDGCYDGAVVMESRLMELDVRMRMAEAR